MVTFLLIGAETFLLGSTDRNASNSVEALHGNAWLSSPWESQELVFHHHYCYYYYYWIYAFFFSFQIFLHICSPPCPQVLCRISACFSSSICKCILFLDSKLCKLVLFRWFISYNRSYFKCLFSGVCFVFEIFLYAMISHLKPCGCHSQGYAWWALISWELRLHHRGSL